MSTLSWQCSACGFVSFTTTRNECLKCRKPRFHNHKTTKPTNNIPSVSNTSSKQTVRVQADKQARLKQPISTTKLVKPQSSAKPTPHLSSKNEQKNKTVSQRPKTATKLPVHEPINQKNQPEPKDDFFKQINEQIQDKLVFSKSKLSKCDSLPSMSSYLSKTNSEFKVELNKHRSAVFRDDKFKANRSSLYLRMEDSDPSYDKLIAKWSQLKDIIKPESCTNVKSSKPSVRSNSSSVEYKFRQGQLGNCWFLCSLASLVHKHPQHLSTLIPDMDLHLKEGIYQVNLCINGAWTSITVDDLFPCDMQNNLVFAQTLDHYYFAPILEKALAKYHSCYRALTSGTPLEGFSTLTGMACYRVLKTPAIEINKFWNKIKLCIDEKFLLATGFKMDRDGLKSRHSYSILDLSEKNKALLLWNPWNKNELRGELKTFNERIKNPNAPPSDGRLWVPFQYFFNNFESVEICNYRPKWRNSQFKFTIPSDKEFDHFPVFELKVNKKTCFDFVLYQEANRDFKPKYNLTLNALIFKCGKNNSFIFHCSETILSNINCFEQELDAGKYLIAFVCFNHWGPTSRVEGTPSFVFSLSGSKSFDLSLFKMKKQILGDLLIQAFLSETVDNSVSLKPNTSGLHFPRFSKGNTDQFYFVFAVNATAEYLYTEIDMSGSSNCFGVRFQTKHGPMMTITPPGCMQIIEIMARESDKKQCSYKVEAKKAIMDSTRENDLKLKHAQQNGMQSDTGLTDLPDLFAPRRIESGESKRQSSCC